MPDSKNMVGANLIEANLAGKDLTNHDLRRADLTRANLKRARLLNASLARANLEMADLEGVNLEGANLKSARLQNSILKKANLKNTDLSWADLRGADLNSANLEGAILDNARLENAILDEAKLTGITYTEWTAWPKDFTPPELNLPEIPRDLFDQIAKHHDLDDLESDVINFMIRSVELIQGELPEELRPEIELAKRVQSGQSSQKELKESRIRAWKYIDDNKEQLTKNTEYGIRALICILSPDFSNGDVDETLYWFDDFSNACRPSEDQQCKIIREISSEYLQEQNNA